LLLYYLQERLL